MNIQARRTTATKIEDLWKVYVRNKTGNMVPLRAIANPRIVLGRR